MQNKSKPMEKCTICGKTYKTRKLNIACLVVHGEGDCCHYGQEEIQPTQKEDWSEKFDEKFPPLPVPKGVVVTCACGKHNTDAVCADREELKSFIQKEIEKAQERAYKKGEIDGAIRMGDEKDKFFAIKTKVVRQELKDSLVKELSKEFGQNGTKEFGKGYEVALTEAIEKVKNYEIYT